ncbi:MAG: hypothetical protein K0Q90_3883 [Paenibacillaceae bacterium]|jgi:hypothetical protein|nr:hypothetical protein [Paenibacillaceae bacterium]
MGCNEGETGPKSFSVPLGSVRPQNAALRDSQFRYASGTEDEERRGREGPPGDKKNPYIPSHPLGL